MWGGIPLASLPSSFENDLVHSVRLWVWWRCRYSNCAPVVGHVTAWTCDVLHRRGGWMRAGACCVVLVRRSTTLWDEALDYMGVRGLCCRTLSNWSVFCITPLGGSAAHWKREGNCCRACNWLSTYFWGVLLWCAVTMISSESRSIFHGDKVGCFEVWRKMTESEIQIARVDVIYVVKQR